MEILAGSYFEIEESSVLMLSEEECHPSTRPVLYTA